MILRSRLVFPPGTGSLSHPIQIPDLLRYWWDDVPIKSHPNIYALANATCSHGEPSVKYRGICDALTREFVRITDASVVLNDEQPSLTNWVILNYSNGTQSSRPPFNRFFYSRIFELILRLKGNYLWPGTLLVPAA